MFGVFSCVGSFQSCSDVVFSNSACEIWGGGLSDVWAIGYSDWQCASESWILCARWFSMHSVPSFLVFMFWSTGMRLAVVMSVQDKLICVCLVMPHCMFSMQLFLSEIIILIESKESCIHKPLILEGHTRGNRVVGEWWGKAVGCLGGMWGQPIRTRAHRWQTWKSPTIVDLSFHMMQQRNNIFCSLPDQRPHSQFIRHVSYNGTCVYVMTVMPS